MENVEPAILDYAMPTTPGELADLAKIRRGGLIGITTFYFCAFTIVLLIVMLD